MLKPERRRRRVIALALALCGLCTAGSVAAPDASACYDGQFPADSLVPQELRLFGNGYALSNPWTDRRGRMDRGVYLSAISYSFEWAPASVYEVVEIPGGERSSRYFSRAHPAYYNGDDDVVDVRVRNKGSRTQTLQPRTCL